MTRLVFGLIFMGFTVGCGPKQVNSAVSDMEAMQVLVPEAIRLWSDYDDMRGTRPHAAIDIKAKKGARILAARSGVVKGRGKHRTAGKWLEIRHDDGVVTPGRAAGDRWGLRYEECLALEAAWQRRRIARLEARIVALETSA